MIGGPSFVAGPGFIRAQARFVLCGELRSRRGLAGEPWVPTRSNICCCTGYVNIVDAVVAVGGAGA